MGHNRPHRRIKVEVFDVIELKEAFAKQVLACTRALGLPDDAALVNAYDGRKHAPAILCFGFNLSVALSPHSA